MAIKNQSRGNQVIFAFTINLETQAATITGNVGVMEAVRILQQIAIALLAKQVQAEKEEKKKK